MMQMGIFQEPESSEQNPDKSLDFEAALSELEKVVLELEGEVKLERALSLFDNGMKLSSQCQKFLQSAEQQIEVLKRAADGTVSAAPFAEDDSAD